MKLTVRLIVMALLFLFLFASLTFADNTPDSKQNIVFICQNDTKLGEWDKGNTADLEHRFNKTFSPYFNVLDGEPYLAKMEGAGVKDLSVAERADIISYFTNDNVAYIIIFEPLGIGPLCFINGCVVPGDSYAYLKVINVKGGTYLDNEKLSNGNPMVSRSAQIKQCYKDAVSKILMPKLLNINNYPN